MQIELRRRFRPSIVLTAADPKVIKGLHGEAGLPLANPAERGDPLANRMLKKEAARGRSEAGTDAHQP